MKQIQVPPGFDGLKDGVLRWLHYEQAFNDRIYNRKVYRSINHTLKADLLPEHRPVWDQEVIWLPRNEVRTYGSLDGELHSAFGIEPSRNKTPLFIHPHAPAGHRRLAGKYGVETLPGWVATPTSSYRSVLGWRRNDSRSPVILKLSLGAVIGRIRRAFREDQVSRGVVVSSLFDTIPNADRKRMQFDWFREPAGMVEKHTGHGWLLRLLPAALAESKSGTAVPVCSLISRRGDDPPLLVELIRRSRQKPETFILERILKPYIEVLAYLLFDQGLEYEGHTQNVLVETGKDGELTGRLFLRDLSDTTVNVSMRMARGKPLPTYPPGFLPGNAPFPHVAEASDFRHNFFRSILARGCDTVEQYGLWGFAWPMNTVLAEWFKAYDAARVEWAYLEMWQQCAVQHLGLRPLFRRKPMGLATDEAIAHFLTEETDWKKLGASRASLPKAAEPLLVDGRMRRRPGRIYDRTECPWGELFTLSGRPAFFRPAF